LFSRCGHCKSLAPVYEQLAKVFEGEKDVIIAKVDATEEKDLSSRYGITGFPTLKFFPHDSSEPMDYNSGRDLESFVSFLNDNAGTHRDADGGLLETAGRIPEFDLFLAESLIDHELAEKLEKKLDALTLKAHDYGKMYLNYVKKVIHKGEEFIDNEMKRLENMVRSTNVSPESRTLFQLKQNILRAFKKEPVADAEGTMKGEL
jgi:protein disulfide-isomerase-like protein